MIVAQLALQVVSARDIHEDFIATIGCDAVAYSSVAR
jgi:hypothetical protein